MEEQYIKLSDLYKVKGIGEKTIERIKETLLQEKNDNTYNNKNIKYKDAFDLPLNNFYIGESVKWMQDNMPSNFVDLTVTSPPYDNLRTYKGFEFDYQSMFEELYRITKPGGVVVWIVGDATINGSETGTSFKQALYAKDIGFNLHDTMIYEKAGFSNPSNNRYHQVFEYMFIFSKGRPKTFNPLKDRKNKWNGSWGNTSTRQKNGILIKKEKTTCNEYGMRFNIWRYVNGKGFGQKDEISYRHPATFPEQLAQDHIVSWSNEGDIVLDPMCGSGTTCKMAYLNKRNFIGIDMSEEYINDICIPRLKDYGWNPNNHQYNNKGDI